MMKFSGKTAHLRRMGGGAAALRLSLTLAALTVLVAFSPILSGMVRAQEVIRLEGISPLRGVYVVPISRYSRADVQLIVLSGTYEETGADGTAHFLEHLVALSADRRIFGGTRSRHWNATTYPVATIYWNAAAVEDLEKIIAYAREVFRTPDLPEEFMLTEAEIVKRELLLKSRRNPYGDLMRDALADLYGGVEGRARQGYTDPDRMSALRVEDALAFHASHYQPSNAVLIVSGSVDVAEVERLVKKYFHDMPDRQTPPKIWLTQRPPADRRIIREVVAPTLPSDQVVYTKFVSIPFDQSKLQFQMAFQIAGWVLESAMTGSLRRSLSLDRFVAAEFDATSYMSINGDLQQVFFITPDAGISPAQALAALEEELARLRTEPVPEETIRTAQDAMIAMLERDGDQPRSYLETFRNFASDGFPPFTTETYVRMLREVRVEEVQQILSALGGAGAVSAILAHRGKAG